MVRQKGLLVMKKRLMGRVREGAPKRLRTGVNNQRTVNAKWFQLLAYCS